MMRKTVFLHPDDVCDKLAEVKALATRYDYSVSTSEFVPRGQMYVFDPTKMKDVPAWVMYDESRRGRRVPGIEL